MASVIQRGGRWYLKIRGPTGAWMRIPSAATTKTEAKKLASELELRHERQRRGLLPMDVDDTITVGSVLASYVEKGLAGKPSQATAEHSVRLHLEPALGSIPLRLLTAGHVEKFLEEKKAGGGPRPAGTAPVRELSPQSLNHLRGYLVRAINRARRNGVWTGPNVVEDVKVRPVPKAIYDFLRAKEFPRFLAALSPERREDREKPSWVRYFWRRWFAVRGYTGLRRGELAGLLKSRVDLEKRQIEVAVSYDRSTTKTARTRIVPLALECVPYLAAAIKETPGDLVFPSPGSDGTMMLRRDAKESAVFKRALRRAEIVTGWEHVCRQEDCDYTVTAADKNLRLCKEEGCGKKLWPKAIVRPNLTAKDMRGTCASLLLEAGASMEVVAQVLGHTDTKITRERYAHATPEWLLGEIDRLSFGVPEELMPVEAAVANMPDQGSEPFGPTVVQGADEEEEAPESEDENPLIPGHLLERAMGFGPTTPSLGSSCSTN